MNIYQLLSVNFASFVFSNTNMLFAEQVGGPDPHDHVRDLHHNHEVSFSNTELPGLCVCEL